MFSWGWATEAIDGSRVAEKHADDLIDAAKTITDLEVDDGRRASEMEYDFFLTAMQTAQSMALTGLSPKSQAQFDACMPALKDSLRKRLKDIPAACLAK